MNGVLDSATTAAPVVVPKEPSGPLDDALVAMNERLTTELKQVDALRYQLGGPQHAPLLAALDKLGDAALVVVVESQRVHLGILSEEV